MKITTVLLKNREFLRDYADPRGPEAPWLTLDRGSLVTVVTEVFYDGNESPLYRHTAFVRRDNRIYSRTRFVLDGAVRIADWFDGNLGHMAAARAAEALEAAA